MTIQDGDVVEIVLDVVHVSDERGEFERVLVQGVFPALAGPGTRCQPALAAGGRRNTVQVFFGRDMRSVSAFLIETALAAEETRP